MNPPRIFFDRKDLFIGSGIALILGPFAIGALWDWLRDFLVSGSPIGPLAIFGVSCCFYVILRAALDVASDLVEWQKGMRFGTPLRSDQDAATDSRNRRLVRILDAEAIIFAGGAIMFVLALGFRTSFIHSRGTDITTLGVFAVAIGGIVMAERTLLLIYPFHFKNWLRLQSRS